MTTLQVPTTARLAFRVYVNPLPQPRVKATGRVAGGRVISRVYTPSKVKGRSLKEFKERVRVVAEAAVRAHPSWQKSRALRTWCRFYIEPPASLLTSRGRLRKGSRRRPTGARDGDGDNLEKGVLDTLKGIVHADDSLIVSWGGEKHWALGEQLPCVEVEVYDEGAL